MKISEKDVLIIQEEWKQGVLFMSQNRLNWQVCYDFCISFVDRLYAYREEKTLFKPTLASETPFRLTLNDAVSYFVGSNSKHSEDKGFALNPWVGITFYNASVSCFESTALAMGHYDFLSKDHSVTRVEYSFVYLLSNSHLKIILHHSSLPYSP